MQEFPKVVYRTGKQIEPFYDPYPPELNTKRQEEFYRRLFDSGVWCYLLNTGSYKGTNIPVHRSHMYIRHILEI